MLVTYRVYVLHFCIIRERNVYIFLHGCPPKFIFINSLLELNKNCPYIYDDNMCILYKFIANSYLDRMFSESLSNSDGFATTNISSSWDQHLIINYFRLQSEEVVPMEQDQNSLETEEIVLFMDADGGSSVGSSAVHTQLSSADITPSVSLNEYLARPVLINTINWATASAVGTQLASIKPWTLFFNTTNIKNKLTNYSFIKCNMKIKVLINASPFYYGAVLGAYQPLQTMNDDTVFDTGGVAYDGGTRYLIPISQRPHFWLYPQESKGAEMTLPFFYYKNLLDITSASQVDAFGQLDYYVYAPVVSANGVASTTVTIQTFAWLEDIELSGPTVALALQSEWGKGSVSKPATAMAKALSYLTKVPIIGDFAKASEMGCKVVAAGASALGYSNLPVVDDTKSIRYNVIPPLATSEIGYPYDKLTFDPKQELSIDPAIVGLDGKDELSIASLVTRESYLTQASWTTANVVNDTLFATNVLPGMFDMLNESAVAGKQYTSIYQTPMCWVSQLFNNWRGDIIFRFKVICSPFHKGRLRISYDPTGQNVNNIGLVNDTSSQVFTTILDIGASNVVELRIPYQQPTTFCLTNTIATAVPYTVNTNATLTGARGFDNGVLNVKVLNVLSAPVATAPITILVSVRGAENLEFANPNLDFLSANSTSTYSYFRTQSEFEPESELQVAGRTRSSPPERYLGYFGEVVPSLRQYLRRMCFVDCIISPNSGSTQGNSIFKFGMTKFPPPVGFDPAGFNNVTGIVPSTQKYTFSKFHPITYISNAFIGTRGSINWNLTWAGSNDVYSFCTLNRNCSSVSTVSIPSTVSTTWGTTSVLQGGELNSIMINHPLGSSGTSAAQNYVTPSLSVACPNYSHYKFSGTGRTQALVPNNGAAATAQTRDTYTYSAILDPGRAGLNNIKVVRYSGIGLDYTLHFFLNVPVIFKYATPAPV